MVRRAQRREAVSLPRLADEATHCGTRPPQRPQ